MNDTVITVGLIISIIVVLPMGILLLKDRIWRRSPDRLAADSRRFTERLLAPDLKALEAHFGHSLPRAIRDLYANREELRRENFVVAAWPGAPEESRWFIAFYQPADAESLREAWPGTERCLAFANDGAGNSYLVDPRREDPPVQFHDHETGEISPVCNSLSQFMRWPRLPLSEA